MKQEHKPSVLLCISKNILLNWMCFSGHKFRLGLTRTAVHSAPVIPGMYHATARSKVTLKYPDYVNNFILVFTLKV